MTGRAPASLARRTSGGGPALLTAGRAVRIGGRLEEPTPTAAAVPRYVVVPAAAGLALLPLLRPSGPGNSSPVDVLIGLTIGCTLIWGLRARIRLRLPYAVPVAILVGAGAIAGLAGPFASLSLLQLVQDLVLFAWCAALVNIARSPASFAVLARTWSLAAVAWAAILVVAYAKGIDAVSGVTPVQGPRASLLAGDPNLLATYVVASIMVTAAAGYPSRRRLRVAAYLVLGAGLALTFSNGGMLAIGVAVAVSLALRAVRRRAFVPAAVPAGLAVVVAGSILWSGVGVGAVQALARDSNQPLLQNSVGRSDQSAWERTTILQESIVLFHQGGLLGWGPRTTKSELAAQQAAYVNEAHDDYFASVIERGLLGGLGLLALIAAIAFRARLLVRAVPAPGFGTALPNPLPLVGAVAAMAVFSTNEQVLHFRQVWALFAFIAAYALWARSG